MAMARAQSGLRGRLRACVCAWIVLVNTVNCLVMPFFFDYSADAVPLLIEQKTF
jgi:hypothetical protein